MRHLGKFLAVAGAAALLMLAAEQAAGGWGPGGGWRWRNGYVHDPAYRWAPPTMKQYIRDPHLYGPACADWRRWQRSW